jgi:3',5'-cyclic AMP phosphodiesterase CpdA
MRLLHLSDPHLQLPDWRDRTLGQLGPLRMLATAELWKGRGAKFDGAARSLAAWARAAESFDHTLLTGDLSQLGLREELELARAALGPLASDPGRFTCLPGNHDRYPWRGRAQRWFEEAFPEQLRSDLGDPLVRVRLLGPVALLLVDSCGTASWPLTSLGRIGAAAIAALRRTLDHAEVRRRCALVAIHHAPLRARGRPRWPRPDLAGHRDFLRACADGGAQAVLAGHVHERFEVPATADRPRILCCGSSTERGREGAFALEFEGARLAAVRRLDGPPRG